MQTPKSFRQTRWLQSVCKDVSGDSAQRVGTFSEVEAMVNDDPDKFFAPPYAKPYEDWCVEDHDAAARIDPQFLADVEAVAEAAYKKAWKWCPHEELCALISDDVSTIYSLLIITNNQLRPFSADRMNWYVAGRVPWGYIGEYPNGKWIVL